MPPSTLGSGAPTPRAPATVPHGSFKPPPSSRVPIVSTSRKLLFLTVKSVLPLPPCSSAQPLAFLQNAAPAPGRSPAVSLKSPNVLQDRWLHRLPAPELSRWFPSLVLQRPGSPPPPATGHPRPCSTASAGVPAATPSVSQPHGAARRPEQPASQTSTHPCLSRGLACPAQGRASWRPPSPASAPRQGPVPQTSAATHL